MLDEASSDALNGEPPALMSLDSPTAETSARPSVVSVAKMPGVTHAPRASMAEPLAGAPAAAPA